MTQQHSQLLVLGAGPGGYAAAFRAADLGMQVTLVDTDTTPGGVCLHRGCIPSKALLHAAKILHDVRDAQEFGLSFGKPQIDFAKLNAWKNSIVEKMTKGLLQLAKARKVEFVQGRGGFVSPNRLAVNNNGAPAREIEFDQAIIAAGSRPFIPDSFPVDSPRLLTSTSALDVSQPPRSLLIIGGGVIGLELGSVYASFGTTVTVVEMLEGLIPGCDRDLARPLQRRLEKSGIKILTSTQVLSLTDAGSELKAVLRDAKGTESSHTFEKSLVSIGRKPNASGLGLNNTQVEIDAKGFIKVDNQMRTSQKNVFAIGDIVGGPMLAHKATHEGLVAAEVASGKSKIIFDAKTIPGVVYTDPEIAWCGLTETQAKIDGREIKIGTFPWAASGRAQTLLAGDGLTKLILDPATDQILGAGIVGTGAGEMISEMVLAIETGCTAKDIALTIHPHPTLSETLMEAAEVAHGMSVHIFKPKK